MKNGTSARREASSQYDAHRQAVAESLARDLEIRLEDGELLLELDLALLSAPKHLAQEIAQVRQHGVGGGWVALNQRRDALQRVEQKVRLQLRRQRRQPGFSQLCSNSLRLHFAVVRPRHRHRRVRERVHREKRQHSGDEPEPEIAAERRWERHAAERHLVLRPRRQHCQAHDQREVGRDARQPMPTVEWKSPRRPDEEWRRKERRIPDERANAEHAQHVADAAGRTGYARQKARAARRPGKRRGESRREIRECASESARTPATRNSRSAARGAEFVD